MNEPSLWIPMLSLTSGAKVTSDDTQHQTQCLPAMAKHPVGQLSGASGAECPPVAVPGATEQLESVHMKDEAGQALEAALDALHPR